MSELLEKILPPYITPSAALQNRKKAYPAAPAESTPGYSAFPGNLC
jgi:hypothetical protein